MIDVIKQKIQHEDKDKEQAHTHIVQMYNL